VLPDSDGRQVVARNAELVLQADVLSLSHRIARAVGSANPSRDKYVIACKMAAGAHFGLAIQKLPYTRKNMLASVDVIDKAIEAEFDGVVSGIKEYNTSHDFDVAVFANVFKVAGVAIIRAESDNRSQFPDLFPKNFFSHSPFIDDLKIISNNRPYDAEDIERLVQLSWKFSTDGGYGGIPTKGLEIGHAVIFKDDADQIFIAGSTKEFELDVHKIDVESLIKDKTSIYKLIDMRAKFDSYEEYLPVLRKELEKIAPWIAFYSETRLSYEGFLQDIYAYNLIDPSKIRDFYSIFESYTSTEDDFQNGN